MICQNFIFTGTELCNWAFLAILLLFHGNKNFLKSFFLALSVNQISPSRHSLSSSSIFGKWHWLNGFQTWVLSCNAGINLTGYLPPHTGLTPGPLTFSVRFLAPRTVFPCKTPVPGSKERNKFPTPGHNLPSLNAKISMRKEHNSTRAVSFQVFRDCPFDNFLLSWE